MEIKISNDYKLLKVLAANREIDKTHVRKLVNSIDRANLLAANPIIVNEKLEILDGQHRYMACQELKIPFYYTVVTNSRTYQDIISINTTSKNWASKDYLEHYIKMGVFEYRVIKQYVELFNMPTSVAIKNLCSGKAPTKDFKVGNIKLKKNIGKYKELFTNFQDFRLYVPNVYKPALVSSYVSMFFNKEFKHKQLMRNMEKKGYKFEVRVGYSDTLRALEEIYNYNKKKQVRFF